MPGLGEGSGPAEPPRRDRTKCESGQCRAGLGSEECPGDPQAEPTDRPLIWVSKARMLPVLAPHQVVHKDLRWGHGSS